MLNRTPARKRKRIVKKIFLWSLLLLMFGGLVGGVGYYLFFFQSQKSLFISPLSGHQTALGFAGENIGLGSAGDEDNEIDVFKKSLLKNKIDFETVISSGSAYVVQLKNGGMVIFSSEKSVVSQTSSLQFILSRLTMEGRTFKRLDLRFDKPVISK